MWLWILALGRGEGEEKVGNGGCEGVMVMVRSCLTGVLPCWFLVMPHFGSSWALLCLGLACLLLSCFGCLVLICFSLELSWESRVVLSHDSCVVFYCFIVILSCLDHNTLCSELLYLISSFVSLWTIASCILVWSWFKDSKPPFPLLASGGVSTMGQFFALPSKDRLYLQVFLSLTPLTLYLSLYVSSYLPFALFCMFICLCLVLVFVFVCLACVLSSVRIFSSYRGQDFFSMVHSTLFDPLSPR